MNLNSMIKHGLLFWVFIVCFCSVLYII